MPKLGVFEVGTGRPESGMYPEDKPIAVDGMYRVSIDPLPGVKIVESPLAVKREEDWSKVRSPARARRRLKQGHRQNVATVELPAAFQIEGVLYCHPEIVRKLEAETKLRFDSALDEMRMRILRGGL